MNDDILHDSLCRYLFTHTTQHFPPAKPAKSHTPQKKKQCVANNAPKSTAVDATANGRTSKSPSSLTTHRSVRILSGFQTSTSSTLSGVGGASTMRQLRRSGERRARCMRGVRAAVTITMVVMGREIDYRERTVNDRTWCAERKRGCKQTVAKTDRDGIGCQGRRERAVQQPVTDRASGGGSTGRVGRML